MNLFSSIWDSTYKFKAYLSTYSCVAAVMMSGVSFSAVKKLEGAGVESIARNNKDKFEPLTPNSVQPPATPFLHFLKTLVLLIYFYRALLCAPQSPQPVAISGNILEGADFSCLHPGDPDDDELRVSTVFFTSSHTTLRLPPHWDIS